MELDVIDMFDITSSILEYHCVLHGFSFDFDFFLVSMESWGQLFLHSLHYQVQNFSLCFYHHTSFAVVIACFLPLSLV